MRAYGHAPPAAPDDKLSWSHSPRGLGFVFETGPTSHSPDAGSVFSSLWARILLCGTYLALNCSLNIINKWTLAVLFKFPITLGIAHQAFAFLALTPVMVGCSSGGLQQHAAVLGKHWLPLLAIATFFSLNLGGNNVSLQSISLSLNQVIRSCIPLATAFGSMLLEAKRPGRQELAALLVLVGGVAVAVWDGGGGARSSGVGIAAALGATLSDGLMIAAAGRALSGRLDVWRVTWMCAPLSVLLLLPFYAWLEAARMAKHEPLLTGAVVWLLLVGSANALLFNLTHLAVIQVTSSVTTSVIGELRMVLLLLMSAIWLGEADVWTAKMVLGAGVALAGAGMYTHSKLRPGDAAALGPVIKGMPQLPFRGRDGPGGSSGRHAPPR